MVVEYVTIQAFFLWYNIKRYHRFVLEMVELPYSFIKILQTITKYLSMYKIKKLFFKNKTITFQVHVQPCEPNFICMGKKSIEIILLLFVKMLYYT